MTIRPAHHDLETDPPWKVQAVFDPDGLGGDFAYTIGLSGLGVPELHAYARPSLGDDPGPDWKFSCKDLCRLLNELGAKLVRGELTVGSTLDREYDGGLVRVRFQLDPPGDREELEAFGAPPHAEVLPVRWSLHRAPEGRLQPMTPEAAAWAAKEYDAIRYSIGPVGGAPGWPLPDEPSFDPAQKYGPRSAVVLGRAAELWHASPEFLASLIGAASHVLLATGSLSCPATWAQSVARPAGRSAQVKRLHDEAHKLLVALENRRAWRRAIELVVGDAWLSAAGDMRRSWRRHCGSLLADVVTAGLLVEAVADVAPVDLVVAGRGPLMGAGRSAGVAPGKEWFAAEEVMRVSDSLTERLDRRQVAAVGAAHLRACEEDEEYGDLEDRLLGWALVSAAGMPDLSLGGVVQVPPGFQRWSAVLTSALTHRARLRAGEVTRLAQPMRALLPRLEQVLNEPIVGTGEVGTGEVA